MFILGIITGINLIGLLVFLLLANSNTTWSLLIVPALDEFLNNHYDLKPTEHKIIKTIFIILFIPAFIFYFMILFALLLIMVFILTIGSFLLNIFTRRKHK